MLDEINKRLNDLKQKAQEFSQSIQSLEWKHESKLSEIKTLESKIEKLKTEYESNLNKATRIIQEATEKAAIIAKEAKSMMEQANQERIQSKAEKEEAIKIKMQAQALMDQANEKQKTADRDWFILKEREKKIKEAVGL